MAQTQSHAWIQLGETKPHQVSINVKVKVNIDVVCNGLEAVGGMAAWVQLPAVMNNLCRD